MSNGEGFDARKEADHLFDNVLLVAIDEIGRQDAARTLRGAYEHGRSAALREAADLRRALVKIAERSCDVARAGLGLCHEVGLASRCASCLAGEALGGVSTEEGKP